MIHANIMINNSHILLDTNILSYLLSTRADLKTKTRDLINKLIDSGNKFYISEFTHYELLRDISDSKRKRCKSLLDFFITINNDADRLDRSTRLYTRYKNVPNVKRMMHGISDVDVFIGSLIFTDEKPFLLTADYTDFPRPFFREVDCWQIKFKNKKGKSRSINYNLLQADISTFL